MESYTPKDADKDRLSSNQFDMVLKKELETQERHESEILALRASAEDVLLWWKSRDPLLETRKHLLMSIPLDKRPAEIQKLNTLFLHGSLTLLHDTISPYLDAEGIAKRESIFHESEPLRSDNIDALFLMIADLVNEQLLKIQEGSVAISKHDMEQLLIAAELAGIGLGSIDIEQRTDYFKHVVQMRNEALDIVSSFISIQEPPNSSENELREIDAIRMLALKSCMQQDSTAENHYVVNRNGSRSNPDVKSTEQMLSYLLTDLGSLFIETNEFNTIWKRLKSRTIRGSLHEVLWYVDCIVLKHMYPEKYSDINIVPASSYANRPEIGRPEHNRAYDFYIRTTKDNGQEIFSNFVQLKSSPPSVDKPGTNKKYHPLVEVLYEQNFMDVNPSRLQNKINNYKKIVERGFTDDDREQLEKYILPTARMYFEGLT